MTRPNQNTYPHDWPTEPFYSHNPTDGIIYLESIIPGPGDKPLAYYYSNEWQEEIAQKARKINAIKLYDLVFILATDEQYPADILSRLWRYSGIDKKTNDRFPQWQSSMAKTERDRAYVWYWLLCSCTIYDKYKGQYPAKSSFFGEINEDDDNDIGPVKWKRDIPLLAIYEYENGQFKKVTETEEQSPYQYIKLDELKTYLKQIDEFIPLPGLLFGENITDDAVKQEEIPKEKILKCGPGTKWEDIRITLISDDTVKIKTPLGEDRFGYIDLGLKDKRNDKPKKLWTYIVIFCYTNGFVSANNFPDLDRINASGYLVTYASKLNKHLQTLFGIEESIYTSHYKKKKSLPGDRARLQNGQLEKKIKKTKGYETRIMFSDATQVAGTKPKPKEQSHTEEIGEIFQEFAEHEKF